MTRPVGVSTGLPAELPLDGVCPYIGRIYRYEICVNGLSRPTAPVIIGECPAAGCRGESRSRRSRRSRSCSADAARASPLSITLAVLRRVACPADVVRVIVGWSDALRAGHVTAAARYFRVPSVFFTGSGPPVELRSLSQVETANAALPCGAKFISARAHGRYVNALFRLTNRDGPGGTAGCGSARARPPAPTS